MSHIFSSFLTFFAKIANLVHVTNYSMDEESYHENFITFSHYKY